MVMREDVMVLQKKKAVLMLLMLMMMAVVAGGDDVGVCMMGVMELMGTAELAEQARGCWKVMLRSKRMMLLLMMLCLVN